MKNTKNLSNKEILRQGSKYNIPEDKSYLLDTTFLDYIYSLDTINFKSEQKNHIQPLQVVYYNNSGNVCSYQINCYAGGFPNLKWNRLGSFDVFPPKKQAPIDSILNLEKQLSFIIPLKNNALTDINRYDYIVVVYWSRYLGRQSKRLIETVQQNLLITKDSVKVIYVNNDYLFYRMTED